MKPARTGRSGLSLPIGATTHEPNRSLFSDQDCGERQILQPGKVPKPVRQLGELLTLRDREGAVVDTYGVP